MFHQSYHKIKRNSIHNRMIIALVIKSVLVLKSLGIVMVIEPPVPEIILLGFAESLSTNAPSKFILNGCDALIPVA